MKSLNKTAAATLEKMFCAAQSGAVKINCNGPDSGIMAVNVEIIARHESERAIISVAHYYEQNGDLMRDPDVEFLRTGAGEYWTIAMRQDGIFNINKTFAELDSQFNIEKICPKQQADCASFCNTWMKNIRWQQSEFFKNGLLQPSAEVVKVAAAA